MGLSPGPVEALGVRKLFVCMCLCALVHTETELYMTERERERGHVAVQSCGHVEVHVGQRDSVFNLVAVCLFFFLFM